MKVVLIHIRVKDHSNRLIDHSNKIRMKDHSHRLKEENIEYYFDYVN
jgi:hypothetical protein